MPLTDAQTNDVYNVLDDALKEIILAESSITTLLGDSTRVKNQKTVEARLRNDVRDFADSELPAISIQTTSGDDADNETQEALREIEKTIPANIWVITRGAARATVSERAKKLTAVVEAFLRKQIHNASELNVELGGTPGVHVKNVSAEFGDMPAQQSQFEVIAEIRLQIIVDICVNLP